MDNKSQTDEKINQTELLDSQETSESENAVKRLASVSAHLVKFLKKTRLSFASRCEESFLAGAIDRLYSVFLFCNIRLVAVFLTSFGISSLLINFAVHFNSNEFFLNTETVSTAAILLIGFLMFTSKKTVGELLSSSKILSQLNIVYSQNAIISFDNVKRTAAGFSTALFIGIILGILSLVYPASVILLFLIALIYSVFILNKPECGLAFVICTFMFSDSYLVLLISIMTFLALIYKYLRGKRHISFNKITAVMLISLVYFLFRGYFTFTGITSAIDTMSYVGFMLVCIATISLITSTSILNRSIKLIVTISRIYVAVFLCYYASLLVFSQTKVEAFMEGFYLFGFSEAISSVSFFAPFLAIALPLNFATMVASKNASGFIKNVLAFIVMLVCSVTVSSFTYLLILLLSCVIVLFVYKKKLVLFAIPAPFIAYLLVKLYSLVPEAYSVSAFTAAKNAQGSADLLKSNIFFGVGIGKNNLNELIGSDVAFNNTILDLTLMVGIVGVTLILVTIAFMVVRNISFIAGCDMTQSYKVRIISAGVLASTLSFTANCMHMNCIYDFRIVFLFAVIMSLGFVSGKCIDSDYIDETMVREYKQF